MFSLAASSPGIARLWERAHPDPPSDVEPHSFVSSDKRNNAISVLESNDKQRGDIVISDPLAYRSQLHIGDSLTLPTDSGPRAFRVAGIYREYGNDRGTVRISLQVYRRFWHDEGITAMGFYLHPGVSLPDVMSSFRAEARGKQSLFIVLGADGSINRLGAGEVDNSDPVLCIGRTDSVLFRSVREKITPELLAWCAEVIRSVLSESYI